MEEKIELTALEKIERNEKSFEDGDKQRILILSSIIIGKQESDYGKKMACTYMLSSYYHSAMMSFKNNATEDGINKLVLRLDNDLLPWASVFYCLSASEQGRELLSYLWVNLELKREIENNPELLSKFVKTLTAIPPNQISALVNLCRWIDYRKPEEARMHSEILKLYSKALDDKKLLPLVFKALTTLRTKELDEYAVNESALFWLSVKLDIAEEDNKTIWLTIDKLIKKTINDIEFSPYLCKTLIYMLDRHNGNSVLFNLSESPEGIKIIADNNKLFSLPLNDPALAEHFGKALIYVQGSGESALTNLIKDPKGVTIIKANPELFRLILSNSKLSEQFIESLTPRRRTGESTLTNLVQNSMGVEILSHLSSLLYDRLSSNSTFQRYFASALANRRSGFNEGKRWWKKTPDINAMIAQFFMHIGDHSSAAEFYKKVGYNPNNPESYYKAKFSLTHHYYGKALMCNDNSTSKQCPSLEEDRGNLLQQALETSLRCPDEYPGIQEIRPKIVRSIIYGPDVKVSQEGYDNSTSDTTINKLMHGGSKAAAKAGITVVEVMKRHHEQTKLLMMENESLKQQVQDQQAATSSKKNNLTGIKRKNDGDIEKKSAMQEVMHPAKKAKTLDKSSVNLHFNSGTENKSTDPDSSSFLTTATNAILFQKPNLPITTKESNSADLKMEGTVASDQYENTPMDRTNETR